MSVLLSICYGMLSVALLLSMVRLMRGPTLPDRVVALDLIALLVVSMIILYDIATQLPIFLDAAIVLALVGFAGTVGFARYLERRGRPD